jgi:hypothetical protein
MHCGHKDEGDCYISIIIHARLLLRPQTLLRTQPVAQLVIRRSEKHTSLHQYSPGASLADHGRACEGRWSGQSQDTQCTQVGLCPRPRCLTSGTHLTELSLGPAHPLMFPNASRVDYPRVWMCSSRETPCSSRIAAGPLRTLGASCSQKLSCVRGVAQHSPKPAKGWHFE